MRRWAETRQLTGRRRQMADTALWWSASPSNPHISGISAVRAPTGPTRYGRLPNAPCREAGCALGLGTLDCLFRREGAPARPARRFRYCAPFSISPFPCFDDMCLSRTRPAARIEYIRRNPEMSGFRIGPLLRNRPWRGVGDSEGAAFYGRPRDATASRSEDAVHPERPNSYQESPIARESTYATAP